jgi:hypothetical protein
MSPSGLIRTEAVGKDYSLTAITQYFYIIPLKDARCHRSVLFIAIIYEPIRKIPFS